MCICVVGVNAIIDILVHIRHTHIFDWDILNYPMFTLPSITTCFSGIKIEILDGPKPIICV